MRKPIFKETRHRGDGLGIKHLLCKCKHNDLDLYINAGQTWQSICNFSLGKEILRDYPVQAG